MCCASLVDRCVLKIAPAITKNSFLFSEKNSEFQKCQKLTVCGQALSMFNYLNLYFPDLSTVSSLAKAADIRVSSRRLIKGTAWENTGRVVSEIQHEISNFAKALKEAVSNSKDGYLNRRRFIFRGKGTQLYFFKIASLRGDF